MLEIEDPKSIIRAIIAQEERSLSEVKKRHEIVCAELERAEQKVENLRAALRTYEGSEDSGPVPSSNGSEPVWSSLSRAEAIRRMMQTRGPLTPGEISKLLTAAGRTGDEPKYVSSGLAAMSRAHKAKSLGGGKWTLTEKGRKELEGQ